MSEIHARSQRLKLFVALALMVLPMAIFYAILCRNAVSIPIMDDYDIVINSLNWISQHHSLSDRLLFLVTREHNGYKLMFESSVVFSQYGLFGQAHFLPLVLFGDMFAGLIFITVLLMSRLSSANSINKWLLLTPVAWLILQLQYASALDFASSSLQHLAVVFFSLFCIYLANKSSKILFIGSCVALVLAIASSPNGFFAGIAGLLMLTQSRRWRRVAAWSATILVALTVYIFRYTPAPQAPGTAQASGILPHVNVIYALSFMGASAARYASIGPSFVLGVILCGVLVFAVKKRYYLQNPPIFYSMLFILINAIAVSGIRSDLGVSQSLASRYREYSNLLLAFSYIFFLETRFPKIRSRALRRSIFGAVLAVSIVFCCLSDLAGARFLNGKKQALTISYKAQWERSSSEQNPLDADQSNPALRRQIDAGLYDVPLVTLRAAVQNGIYSPPKNP